MKAVRGRRRSAVRDRESNMLEDAERSERLPVRETE